MITVAEHDLSPSAENAGNAEIEHTESTTDAAPARTLFDPQETLDNISRRILAIELANGVGLAAREIKEIGRINLDEDTINRRRNAGAYQRVLTEMRKDAIELIKDTQSQAIRKLREQINDKDPRIAQRAALFFAEATMSAHIKKAEFELELELQKREQSFVKKTIIEFEMDSSIPVLGEPLLIAPADEPPPSESKPDASKTQEIVKETAIEQQAEIVKKDASSKQVELEADDDDVLGGVL